MTPGRRALRLAVLAVGLPAAAPAQQAEPLLDRLAAVFDQDALHLGLLIQLVGDVQPDRTAAGHNGASVANARLGVSGRLDGGWTYSLQTQLTGSPAILDARIGHVFEPWLTVELGRFKAPFSREALEHAGDLDLIGRSRVATALALGRQVGAQVRGRLARARLEYAVGAFNGNGLATGNDDDDVLVIARLVVRPGGPPSAPDQGALEIGVNAAASHDAAAPLGRGFVPSFAGRRVLGGVDARWRRGRLLLAAEFDAARLDSLGGGRRRPAGWQATAGWQVTRRSQVLARWDALRPDGIGADSDHLVLGWNRAPTRATRIQLNWVVDLADAAPRRQQLLALMQVGF